MKRRDLLGMLAAIPLAQVGRQQQQAPQRRRIVPRDVITRFKLKISNGYGPFVLGEDGLPYDLDDVIAVLFEATREHWASRK